MSFFKNTHKKASIERYDFEEDVSDESLAFLLLLLSFLKSVDFSKSDDLNFFVRVGKRTRS
jgi:hypothetical protein